MGVDYTGHHGIGYQVEDTNEVSESAASLIEYIDEALLSGFCCFEVGNESYSGTQNDTYLAVVDPFEHGLDLSIIKGRLDEEISRLNLTKVGEFGSIGGIEMW